MPHDAHIPVVTDETPPHIARLMRGATYASVSVALVLIALKLFAWVQTGSVTMLSSLVDSFLDAAASIITLVAVMYALKPADADHRFGHGKSESLAGLGQSAFIAASAFFILFEAGERMINPREITQTEIGLIVMGISLVLTISLVVFQIYVVKKTSSVAVAADSLHYKTDILVNIGVIVALGASSYLGLQIIDPLFGIAIALYILWSAREIAMEAIDHLLDRELPDEEREKILRIARKKHGVREVHDLRTRSSGTRKFIQLHLVLDGFMSLHDAHEIGDSVMYALEDAFPNAEVLVHLDPHDIDEPVAEFKA